MTKPRKDGEAVGEAATEREQAARAQEVTAEEQAEDPDAPDEVQEQQETETPDQASEDQETGTVESAEAVDEGQVEDLRRERDEFREKWLRTAAELENVRKRSRRELLESRRFAQADALRPFLKVLDDFERALQTPSSAADNQENEGFREGIELILQKFQGLLKDLGVEPVEALAQPFDPNVHEAVGQLAREGAASGEVIEVVQQGYRFQDLVLRPARVIVAG